MTTSLNAFGGALESSRMVLYGYYKASITVVKDGNRPRHPELDMRGLVVLYTAHIPCKRVCANRYRLGKPHGIKTPPPRLGLPTWGILDAA